MSLKLANRPALSGGWTRPIGTGGFSHRFMTEYGRRRRPLNGNRIVVGTDYPFGTFVTSEELGRVATVSGRNGPGMDPSWRGPEVRRLVSGRF